MKPKVPIKDVNFKGVRCKCHKTSVITLLQSLYMQHYLEMFYKPACISYFINCGSPLNQFPGPSENSGCF